MPVIKISIITSIYKGLPYLEPFLLNFLNIENLEETELIIIHNNPSDEEKKIIDKYRPLILNLIYQEVELEPIYTSWNRAIKLSTGEYIAMWSVDDRRTPNSLVTQALVLDKDPECMIVSGNYYKVFNYSDTNGYLKKDPVKRNRFNNFPKFNNGCFLMWRKSVHQQIGFFDEQFKIGGDWEFWSRVTSNFKALPCDCTLGYFLRARNEGLSKKKSNVNDIENQIVHMRYYLFYIINIYTLLKIRNIKLNEILNNDKYKKIKVTNRFIYISLVPSLFLFWIPRFKRFLANFIYKRREESLK